MLVVEYNRYNRDKILCLRSSNCGDGANYVSEVVKVGDKENVNTTLCTVVYIFTVVKKFIFLLLQNQNQTFIKTGTSRGFSQRP